MYQQFFSLKIKPFSISPDPNFMFLSERHKEAIAHLQHGLEGRGGFALLTGEVGTGKTTICRSLMENMGDDTDVAFILNPALSDIELLSTICDSFHIECQHSDLSDLFNHITQWLIANNQQHRRSIIIIDEAQHLSFAALEQLRLLTDLENKGKKLLQVILIGQTELQAKLKQTEFLSLAQRISARYHLLSLSQQESNLYIQHRLNVAGSSHAIFDKSALKEIFKKCNGIPRLTNILCDRSLLAAYTQDSHIVTLKMVKQVSQEIHFTGQRTQATGISAHWRFSAVIILTLLTLWQAPQILNYVSHNAIIANVNAKQSFVSPTVTEPKQRLAETNSGQQLIETPNEQQWLDAYPTLDMSNTDYRDALSTLYAVWGYQIKQEDINCELENSANINCYSRNMSLQHLKQLNYPSVVRLEKDAQNAIYAVLYKITESYQLLIDGHLISVSESWFTNYWNGEATLLWQAPFPIRGVIKLGQEGKKVTWLANQLSQLQGLPSENKAEFDLRLLDQVSDFQRQQGLLDDGIVGTRTLMSLTQLVAPNAPRLVQEAN